MAEADGPVYRFYGRRQGKKRSARQDRLLDELLPRVSFSPDKLATEAVAGRSQLWLEIGFGAAEHLLAQARSRPDVTLIGAEPFLDGVVKALDGIEADGLDNLLIHADDVRPLLDTLPDACLDRVFILFPDPWPKRRHHKRRMVSPENLDRLARVMRPGAHLRLATDHMEYGAWMLWHTNRHPAFEWLAERADDWRLPPQDHVTTRFQQKQLAGSQYMFLEFERR